MQEKGARQIQYGSDTTKGRRAPFYRFTNRFKKMNGEQTLKLWTDPKRTVALSGNRPHKIGPSVDSRTVRETIIRRMAHAVSRLYKEGYDTYLCGLAMGFDLWAALAVSFAKNYYPDLRLIAVVPFRGQEQRYDPESRECYRTTLNEANYCVCLYERYPGSSCYHERNRAMLDHASMLVCYHNGESGGTASTVAEARTRDMPVLNLYGTPFGHGYNWKVDGELLDAILRIR